MKIVRLTAKQLRAWRENVSHLVDDAGHLVAPIDRALDGGIATVVRSARSQRKTLEQKVAIGSGPARREHVVRVEVTRTGIDANDIALTTLVDGHRVVSGREVIAAQMLAEYGECQLRASNGVIIKVVRDPGIHRPTFQESLQIAPKPEHCPCRAWGHPHPGRHYPTCQFNRLAPPDERALSDVIPEEDIRVLPTEAFAALARRPAPNPATTPIAARVDPRAVVTEAPPLDPPESCRNGCLEWATPKGYPIPPGQHHPTCMFAKAWAIKTSSEIPRWLVDLRSGEKVRLADREEIGQAEVAAQRTGSPIIHLNDVPYAVVLETELIAEEAEARGAIGAPVAVGVSP